MPLGKYENFAECQSTMSKKLGSPERAKKYCGKLFWKVHGKEGGKKALKKKLEEFKVMLNDNQ